MSRKGKRSSVSGSKENTVSSRTRSKTGKLMAVKLSKPQIDVKHIEKSKPNQTKAVKLGRRKADDISCRTRSKTGEKKKRNLRGAPSKLALKKKSTGKAGSKQRKPKNQGKKIVALKSSPANKLPKSAKTLAMKGRKAANVKKDGTGKATPRKKQVNTGRVKRAIAIQSEGKRSSPRLALSINLKYADKERLRQIFGRTDVTREDIPEVILQLIFKDDPTEIKWLLDMGYQPFSNRPQPTITNQDTFPIFQALITASYECLEMLLKFGFGFYKKFHMWIGFKFALLKTAFMYPDAPEVEMVPFMRCVRLMLHHGVPVCMVPVEDDRWVLTKKFVHIEQHSELLTYLFVAGARFDVYPTDAFPLDDLPDDHPDFKPNRITKYIADRFLPSKDENGFLQPDTLEEISRDFIRNHLIDCNYTSNLFVLVPKLPISKPTMELLLYFKTLGI